MAENRDTARDLETIVDPAKIQMILSKHLAGKYLFIKEKDPPEEAMLSEVNADNTIAIKTAAEFTEGQHVLLFRVMGRYIQLACEVLVAGNENTRSVLQVKTTSIAKTDRQFIRVPIADNAYISNVRASKHYIDASLNSIPTSVKVTFSMYEQKLKENGDFVKIEVFKRDPILDVVRKTGKSLLIRNTADPKCYRAESDFFVDLVAVLREQVKHRMLEYKQLRIVSDIIVPINYITHDETKIPLGYIQVQSRTQNFDDIKLLELQQMAFEIVDKIRDANTVYIKEKQRISNLSRGGLKVEITNPDLKNYLARQTGFTFDLFFRMQAPITLYGSIRSATTDADGKLLLGIQITGNSAREGEMKRFKDNVMALESELATKQKRTDQILGKKSS